MPDNEVGKMEEAALKRKERLRAMKRKRDEKKDGNGGENEGKEKLPEPQLKFRNYQTENSNLKEAQMDPIEPADIKEHIAEQLESENAMPAIEVDLFKLAPRKPDWDLKRDLQKRLDKLERRTSQAIADIVREKLTESAKSNIANVSAIPDVPAGTGYESD